MRYLINLSYDGSSFYGYQIQNNKLTVEGELERVLSKILNEKVNTVGSSRTDKGVHALNQYCHFDTEKNINPKNLAHSLNSLVNESIYIKKIKKVNNELHARYSVVKKEYIYKINMGEYNPLENYDRQENWTDTLDSDTTNNSTDNTTETNTTAVSSSTSTEGSESDNGSVENTVSAFDSNSYQPSDKSTSDNSTSTSTESSSNTNSSAGLTHNSTVTDTGTKDDTSVHTGRVHGNIGVTTSQQMLQSELDIAKFNIVQQITDLFISEFCIMIYT